MNAVYPPPLPETVHRGHPEVHRCGLTCPVVRAVFRQLFLTQVPGLSGGANVSAKTRMDMFRSSNTISHDCICALMKTERSTVQLALLRERLRSIRFPDNVCMPEGCKQCAELPNNVIWSFSPVCNDASKKPSCLGKRYGFCRAFPGSACASCIKKSRNARTAQDCQRSSSHSR